MKVACQVLMIWILQTWPLKGRTRCELHDGVRERGDREDVPHIASAQQLPTCATAASDPEKSGIFSCEGYEAVIFLSLRV